MEIRIRCTHCEAENYVEEGHEFIFCSSCGHKINIRYTGEVSVMQLWERKLKDALACIETEEYEKAERILTQLIKDYPQNYYFYEPLVEAVSKKYTEMQNYKKGRILGLADRAIALASDEETREAFLCWKQSLIRVFADWEVYEAYTEWSEKKRDAQSNVFAYVMFFAVSLLLFGAAMFIYKDPAVIEITRPMFGGSTIICGIMLLINAMKYIKILRRCEKLDAELEEINKEIEKLTI